MSFASPRSGVSPRYGYNLSPRVATTSPRNHRKYVAPSLDGYSEEEMVAESRRRLEHKKNTRIMKYLLKDVAQDGRSVKTDHLLLAAKIAKIDVSEDMLREHAASTDRSGSPRRVNWRPLVSQMPPPALVGPGGFEKLPVLRKHRIALAQAVVEEAATQVVVEEAAPRPSAKDVAYWFNFLQSKLKDRFTEVRRAFRILDEDFSGFLNRDEFKKVMAMFNLENSIPDHIFTEILALIDKDGDGTVTYAEFSKLLAIEDVLDVLKANGLR